MIHLDRIVIVEGKYDKIKLSNLLDAVIVTTDGFQIFKDKEKQKFIRNIVSKKGAVILTDSDSAGFLIRNRLSNILAGLDVVQVYIPDIFGKEKRKAVPGAEGKLGVEGVPEDVILSALERAGVSTDKKNSSSGEITTSTLFEYGLSGTSNSSLNREKLLKKLDLPSRIKTPALLKLLNSFMTLEEFIKIAQEEIE